ncbi:MAG: 5-oxoprolinase subunit PxpB [Pseudomonadota bacterium]
MRFLSLGDRALTVEYASGFDPQARKAVIALDEAIREAREAGSLSGILDVAPTFRSLTVHYDPLQINQASLKASLMDLARPSSSEREPNTTLWRLPVCYGGSFGPDLPDLVADTGLSEADVIELHSSIEVSVHMLGFLPGFAFMGDIAEPLRKPRRQEPRLRVPPGSVAVADRLTAIYPWESPGGWHLIGACPVPLFFAEEAKPTLFEPGDRVRFEPVTKSQFEGLKQQLNRAELSPQSFRKTK